MLCVASPARAAGPLGDNGTPIRTSAYGIDLTPGPLLLGTRALGLGGAYVAIAEGVDGNLQNPAAPAVRAAWSQSHIDYDAALGVLFPSTLESSDYFNTGRGTTDIRRSNPSEFAILAPAVNLQVGPWGGGLGVELQRYGLTTRLAGGREELVRAQFSVVRTSIARAVDDGQVVAGLGLLVTALDITTRDEVFTRSGNLFTTRGVNMEGGLLFRPDDAHFRVGCALRAPVISEVDSRAPRVGEDIVLGDPASGQAIFLPERVKRPWNADVGVAIQLGPRPLNPPWIDPALRMRPIERWLEQREHSRSIRQRRGSPNPRLLERQLNAERERDARVAEAWQRRMRELLSDRYAELPRSYVLLSAALHVDGSVENAVGIESFLSQRVDRAGEATTFSPRLGVELEPWHDRLQLRGGSYLEPSRFRAAQARVHGTFGFDLRLFSWTVFGLAERRTSWRAGAVIDLARDYLSWGVSLGVWH
jgi:hypothetical protein